MYRPLELGLVSRYSSLFDDQRSMQDDFTFECTNGWFDLIAANLKLVERYAELERLKVEITQVKEKFGLLRMYHRGGDEVVDRLLDIAELVSASTCEVCGAEANVVEQQGWLRACCHLHREVMEPGSVLTSKVGYIDAYVKCVALLLWFFKDNSVRWVNQECLGLGGRCPSELLASSEGCEQVYTLIRRLESGVAV
ncbi:antitoxin Xre/MbcA/ParS toxin-binding domain-containing protein [Pseudomonas sp. NPDC089758]|uniref:antitoxin Xre/MbcA/ParS toxin-binding domain-containing protein n=1 Tax=Pseudomonas sp. NPDC089758 TaxID=3364473 RepID=UPI003827A4FD